MEDRQGDLTQYVVIRAVETLAGTRYVIDGEEHEWLTTAVLYAISRPVVCRVCSAVYNWYRRSGTCPECGKFAERHILVE